MAPKKASQKKREIITELPGGALRTIFPIGRSNLMFEFWANLLLAQPDPKPRIRKQKAPEEGCTMSENPGMYYIYFICTKCKHSLNFIHPRPSCFSWPHS